MLLTTRQINARAATIRSMLEAADAVVPRLRRRLATRIGWDQAVAAWDASYERQAEMYD
jgi:hypothetical protein